MNMVKFTTSLIKAGEYSKRKGLSCRLCRDHKYYSIFSRITVAHDLPSFTTSQFRKSLSFSRSFYFFAKQKTMKKIISPSFFNTYSNPFSHAIFLIKKILPAINPKLIFSKDQDGKSEGD